MRLQRLACLLLLLWAASGAAASADDEALCAYSGIPVANTASRVEARISVDGTLETLQFASLYNWLAWMMDAHQQGRVLDWPPEVQVVDYPLRADSHAPLLRLPLEQLSVELATDDLPYFAPLQPDGVTVGPWIVTTDFLVEDSVWPNFVCCSDLETAGRLAAASSGAIYNWDAGLMQLLQEYRMLNAPSGTGGPDSITHPYIYPGSDDDLK
jgi:hypothetical protein